ncbi:MAG: chemotaxis protein CheC [Candidatus Methanospirareceae archaeon]
MDEKEIVEDMEGGEESELELSAFQRDALNELGNIASCHAVTALAELTGMTIDIEVPSVDVVRIGEAAKLVDAEKIVAGNMVKLEGGFSGYLQVLFPERSAFLLVDSLLSRTPGETKSIETEMEQSALAETGNILASSFCSAIADFFQFTLMPTPPAFAFDMAGAMVESAMIAVAQAHHGTEHVILFKCDFNDENDRGIYGYIMLFPHQDSLGNILAMLEEKVS